MGKKKANSNIQRPKTNHKNSNISNLTSKLNNNKNQAVPIKPQQQKKYKPASFQFKKIIDSPHNSVSNSQQDEEKSQYEFPVKVKNKISKKKNSKSSKINKKSKTTGIKLQRGYKFCQNCQTVLNIHKYVCTQCGFVHNMKKHKFDVMKNLSKATPKIVKSIIQSNEFNTIDLKKYQKLNIFEPFIGKIEQEAQYNDLKSKKIIFESLKIFKNDQICERTNEKLDVSQLKNKTEEQRQQFSLYKSEFPITALQTIQISNSQQNEISSNRILIFIESVAKKQIFPSQNDSQDILYSTNLQTSQNQQSKDKSLLIKKQEINQQKLKVQEQKVNSLKLRENNILTEKALNLQKYHKIGSYYSGQSTINFLFLQKPKQYNNSSPNYKANLQIPKENKKRSSSRTVKQSKKIYQEMPNIGQAHVKNQNNHNLGTNDEHSVIKIGIKQHIEMIKSLNNKIAILTGRKEILLMNVNLNDQNKFEKTYQNTIRNKENVNLWLQNEDFSLKIDNQKQKYEHKPSFKQSLSLISLSKDRQLSYNDDQFTVIQWLKHFHSFHNLNQNKKSAEQCFLVTGTLFGHVLIYKISPENSYEIYRTITGAHFQMVNFLSECFLNINGTALFASASFDGSVKIWQLNLTQPVSQFQVSNRKIQSIHWDSGAKFLLIVRDEGLQNCYLACFYSVNNRIQLPMMLADTIDFRLIRNGAMFDNSCSPLISFPLNSKIVLMLNSRNGFLKILETQELRKTSLKRKKSKKNHQQFLYNNYWIRMKPNHSSKLNTQKQQKQIPQEQMQIIQMKVDCNHYANFTYNLKAALQLEQEKPQQKWLMIPEQNQQAQSPQNFQEESLGQETNKKQQKSKNTQQIKPIINKKPLHLPEPIGIRKSLRVRKPNIQYNFIDQQENQSQKSIHNKRSKSNSKNKKKKISSDDEDFSKQSSSQSQGMDSSISDESFKKVQIMEQKSSKNNPKQMTSKSKKDKKSSIIGKLKQTNKNSRLKKERQQIVNKKTQMQQLFYRMFWQQTNQQSLVNQKQNYPCNKFPKFSGMTSFLSFSTQNQQKNIKQGKFKDEVSEHNDDNIQADQQVRSEYLTSFISTYTGQLIKIKIKINGYHQLTNKNKISSEEEQISD